MRGQTAAVVVPAPLGTRLEGDDSEFPRSDWSAERPEIKGQQPAQTRRGTDDISPRFRATDIGPHPLWHERQTRLGGCFRGLYRGCGRV